MVRALTSGGLLALALTACGVAFPVPERTGPEEAAQATGVRSPGCPASRGHLVLERINQIRRDHGLRPLRAEERLVRAALAHTADQAAGGPARVGHIGSDGSAPGDRATAARYEWSLVAENVAAGVPSAAEVVAGWMRSPSHRATILSPDAVHAGVGYVHRLDGRFDHYWTLMVAAPRPGTDNRLMACHP